LKLFFDVVNAVVETEFLFGASIKVVADNAALLFKLKLIESMIIQKFLISPKM